MMGKQKQKRQPFSEEEKQYIFEMMLEAKTKGLSLDTVAKELADQLDSSFYTIKNVYGKVANKKKEEALSHITTSINEVAEADIIEEPEDELTEYVKADIEQTISLADAVKEYKQSIIAEYEQSNPKVTKQVVEVDLSELVGSQTKALLERIEELIEERNGWKNKAEDLEKENAKLKEKFMNHILSN